MKFDLFSPRNRRSGQRFLHQAGVRCNEHPGRTLDVSDRGARLVVRGELPHRFDLTLDLGQPVSVRAERVWEQLLGPGGTRVVGVRFTPSPQVAEALTGLR